MQWLLNLIFGVPKLHLVAHNGSKLRQIFFTHLKVKGPRIYRILSAVPLPLFPGPSCSAPDACFFNLVLVFCLSNQPIQLTSRIVYLPLNSVFPQMLYPLDLPEIENQADAKEADIDLSHPSSDSWARFPRLLLMWRRARQLLQQLLQ